MNVSGFIDFEFDAARFDFPNCFGGVVGDGASLGVGHESARAQHFAQLTDFGHGVGRGNGHIKIRPAFLALLDEIFEADVFGARGLGRLGGSAAFGKNQHLDGLAAAMRQRDRAAHHLVGLLGIDSQAERQIDGLVELGFGKFGQHFDGRFERI